MKKSVKCFLLALMVLCLSATAGFAAATAGSYDISIDLTLGKGMAANVVSVKVGSESVATHKPESLDEKAKNPDLNNGLTWIVPTTKVFNISYDVTVYKDSKPEALVTIKWTPEKEKGNLYMVNYSGDVLSKDDLKDNKVSIDIPAHGTSVDMYIVVSGGPKSGDALVKVKVAGFASGDPEPVGGPFSDATVTFTIADEEVASFDVTSEDSFALANASFDTVTSDDAFTDKGTYEKATAGEKVTFAVSGTSSASIKAVYFVNADEESSDITGKKTETTITDGENTFYFVFASGDKLFSSAKYVISTGGGTTGGLDYGTIHFAATSGDTTVASFDVVSDDYKSGFVASGDSTATAISKTGTFPTTATVKITVDDDGADGTAEVYDIFFNTKSVSGDYTASTNVFDPKGVEGTYKVVFVTDDTADKPYFAVEFKVAGSSVAPDPIEPEDVDSTKGTDTEALAPTSVTTDSDGNTVTYIPANFNLPVTLKDGVWTFTSIASKYLAIATAALDKITTSDLVAMLTDAKFAPGLTGEYTYVGAKLKKKVYPGTIFIIRLVLNASGGSVNAAAGTTIEGAMTVEGEDAKTATDELAIDTTDLRDPSDGTKTIDVPAGNYNITYSSLNGEVVGGLNEAVPLAGNEDVDPIIGSNKGSSSGCDAGFGALALLALALPLVKKIKK